MLYQIHHQFKNGHTEMLEQREINNHEEFKKLMDEMRERHPCPKGVQYLACTEDSEHFWWTTAKEESTKLKDKIKNEN